MPSAPQNLLGRTAHRCPRPGAPTSTARPPNCSAAKSAQGDMESFPAAPCDGAHYGCRRRPAHRKVRQKKIIPVNFFLNPYNELGKLLTFLSLPTRNPPSLAPRHALRLPRSRRHGSPSGSWGVFWLANNDLGTRSVRKTSKSSQLVIPRFRFPKSRITAPGKITVQGTKVVLFKLENASGPETHAVETGRRQD